MDGFFVTTPPMRADCSRRPSVGDLEIHFHEGTAVITGQLVHATAVVAGETAAALPAFLGWAGGHPERPLSEIPMPQIPMSKIGVPR